MNPSFTISIIAFGVMVLGTITTFFSTAITGRHVGILVCAVGMCVVSVLGCIIENISETNKKIGKIEKLMSDYSQNTTATKEQ